MGPLKGVQLGPDSPLHRAWRDGPYSVVVTPHPPACPAVMPCRSDKTRSGMARFGHLADGRIKLVLVRKCSPVQVGAHETGG